MPGTTLGSVHYFSPEQARGEMVTTASDVYSAGLVLFEMLTGRRAWTGDSAGAVAVARLAGDPPLRRPIQPGRAAGPRHGRAQVAGARARGPADRRRHGRAARPLHRRSRVPRPSPARRCGAQPGTAAAAVPLPWAPRRGGRCRDQSTARRATRATRPARPPPGYGAPLRPDGLPRLMLTTSRAAAPARGAGSPLSWPCSCCSPAAACSSCS